MSDWLCERVLVEYTDDQSTGLVSGLYLSV